MNQPQLSIIVPVYNVESYIRNCIGSIQTQTFRDFELILVDDGSCDRSGLICDDYARRDSRIRVIHKKNEGAWSARNMGLDHAQGLYIMFADPDDELGTSDTIEKNINLLSDCSGNTFVQFPSLWFYSENHKGLLKQTECQYVGDFIFKAFFDGIITPVVWDKIYRKEIFANIRFPQLRYYEDAYFLVDILNNTDNVVISDHGYYKYCIRDGSSMKSNWSTTKIADLFYVISRLIDFARKRPDTKIYCVTAILPLIDDLVYIRSQLTPDLFDKYCSQLSKLLPDYASILYFIFKQTFIKGFKVLIIKLLGVNLYYRMYFILHKRGV